MPTPTPFALNDCVAHFAVVVVAFFLLPQRHAKLAQQVKEAERRKTATQRGIGLLIEGGAETADMKKVLTKRQTELADLRQQLQLLESTQPIVLTKQVSPQHTSDTHEERSV